MERRQFLGTLGKGVGASAVATIFNPTTIARIEAATVRVSETSPKELAQDEAYWSAIQQSFTISRSLIDLNNGYCSPSPRIVTQALVNYIWQQEEAPSYQMRLILEPRREAIRQRLARLFNCSPEEIALVRNASEAMEILLLGIDLKSGDEALTTNQDYGRMRTTLDQRHRREGIKVNLISIPIPPDEMGDLTEAFRQAITSKTKIILLSHQVNLTGQIFPVKDICDMAAAHDIEVLVDGAHSFCQFDFIQPEIGCNYFGTSLHKWLMAPKGTGMLYVKRDKIEKIWPLMAARKEMNADIRKFEEIGTHSAAIPLATGEAVTYHNAIGGKRKEERLRYLKDYWAKRLVEHPKIRLHTSLKRHMSCAIGTVEIVGIDPDKLTEHLWNKHQIVVTPINHDEFKGIRITPNLYTQLSELDHFCEVIEHLAEKGLPKSV